jgi:hypothetical protein
MSVLKTNRWRFQKEFGQNKSKENNFKTFIQNAGLNKSNHENCNLKKLIFPRLDCDFT